MKKIYKEDLIKEISAKLDIPEGTIINYMEALKDTFSGKNDRTELEQEIEKKFPFTVDELEQMENETIVNAIEIIVECKMNDTKDRLAGGPEYLGYCFLIDNDEKDEMKEFIMEQINLNKQYFSPLCGSIYFSENITTKKKELWNKTMIGRTIYKGYE